MKKKKQTLLWELRHPQEKRCSYLFGTMHVKDEKAFHLLDLVKSKIDEVDALANEFHFADIQTQTDPTAMQLPEGETLQNLLRPKVYKKLEQLLVQQLQLPIAFFQQTLPLMVNNFLAERMLADEMPVSLDQSLYHYALEQEKQTLGIESYAEQLETLRKIPLDYQVKSLEGTVQHYGAYRKEIYRMMAAYQAGAIDKLYHASKKSLKGMRKLLLYNRNEVMAERIATYTTTQTMVCAIGAAHLWGKKGVLRLLKLQGVQVRPIPMR